MFSNRESLEIIKAILALASNLNIDVVAEGLEMREQLTQIRGMKCQYGQGFLFSKPMAPSAVDSWIRSEKSIMT
jgi:EAL domain-containing protein (putative c-di-GMP-specific phosphodiesterase class I)